MYWISNSLLAVSCCLRTTHHQNEYWCTWIIPGLSQNGLGTRIYTGHRCMLESDWLVWNIWRDNQWGIFIPYVDLFFFFYWQCWKIGVYCWCWTLMDFLDRLCWSLSKHWNKCFCRLGFKNFVSCFRVGNFLWKLVLDRQWQLGSGADSLLEWRSGQSIGVKEQTFKPATSVVKVKVQCSWQLQSARTQLWNICIVCSS